MHSTRLLQWVGRRRRPAAAAQHAAPWVLCPPACHALIAGCCLPCTHIRQNREHCGKSAQAMSQAAVPGQAGARGQLEAHVSSLVGLAQTHDSGRSSRESRCIAPACALLRILHSSRAGWGEGSSGRPIKGDLTCACSGRRGSDALCCAALSAACMGQCGERSKRLQLAPPAPGTLTAPAWTRPHVPGRAASQCPQHSCFRLPPRCACRGRGDSRDGGLVGSPCNKC